MFSKEILKECSLKTGNRLDYVERELKRCPSGRLFSEKHRGKEFLVQETYENGGRKRRLLTKFPDVAQGLIRKEFLLMERDVLRKNLDAVGAALKEIEDVDYSNLIKYFRNDFELITDDMIACAMSDPEALSWATQEYHKSNFMPEEKRHATRMGFKVRSKSELTISEMLYEYKLPTRYEQVIVINGVEYAPDFTIRRADGKIFYWEHEGLMNKASYRERQARKHLDYESVGIVPWRNLIVTYDNEYGDLDARIIESEIRNKLLL